MFNKFEVIGFGFCILAMAIALFVLRMDTSFFGLKATTNEITQAGTAIIAVPTAIQDGTDQQTLLRNSLSAATDNSGTVTKLVNDDVKIGTGPAVVTGDSVTVNYIGTLQNGTEFDNSYKRGSPIIFTVGEGKVIKGWDQGIVGMKVGGKRILVVPSTLGYGSKGYGPIPGDASLVFAIELVSIN